MSPIDVYILFNSLPRKMRFSLIFFMNLAAIASTGSPRPSSLLTNIPQYLPKQCPQFVDRLKKFENCDVPRSFNASFPNEALPFICFLTLNTVLEMCKDTSSGLSYDFDTYYKAHVNCTICPFNYSTASRNLGEKVNDAAEYFRIKKNCEEVCGFSNQTVHDCLVMKALNDELTRFNENVVGAAKQGEPRESRLRLEQNTPSDASKLIVRDRRPKAQNSHGAVFQTKAEDSAMKHDETVGKTENKTGVKTETTSECETKEKEGKTVNANNVDARPKSNISENSKGISYSDIIKTTEKEVSYKSNAYVSSNNNNINSNNNNSNNNNNDDIINNVNNNKIHDNIHHNNNDKEAGTKVWEGGMNAGKIDFSETEVPPVNEINDPGTFSPQLSSSGKKDYAYGSTIKSLPDEAEDDENNEEMQESPQSHVMPDREYQAGKVLNPKELYNGDGLFQAEDSHFSAFFLMTISIIIIGYIVYHNKNKIVAYALEGRRGRSGRRRPTSASYRKLDCNLEEAIASNPSHASVTSVVY